MPFADFTGLAIVSLIMGFVALRTLYQVIRDRKKLFDDNFTRADRQQMSVAAFLILLPISVLLHEVGHAVEVWYFGGEVLRFGFFFFFGFVEHRGFYTVTDLFWIALWGNIVSVVLGLGALALAFLRPMRAAINYLLIMFGIISILTSLVFYPMFDFISGLHGDWSQIYSGDTPGHSLVTGIVHGAIVLGLVVAYQIPRVRLRFAEITGLQPEEMRKLNRKQAEQELVRAAELAAAGFHGPARLETAGSSRDAAAVRLSWTSGGYSRTVLVVGVFSSQLRVEIIGGVQLLDGTGTSTEQRIQGIRGFPEPERIAPYIARALKQVDGWRVARRDDVAVH